ncbi:MAG: glycosyltransferase [Cyanobacteria bacterium RI_101]|nr:glycosyltransferase [Cyanobacteria bacterium RI_101]
MSDVPVLSIVIPIYNEEPNIPALLDRLSRCLKDLGLTYEIICVNDGSRDASLARLIDYRQSDSRLKIIDFSRNFGKEIALTAGLDYAQGRAVIFIDADLQDPPELIGDLVSKWREGFEVVYGTRSSRRGDSFLKRLTAHLFYRTLGKMSPLPIPANTGDFRLLDRRAADALKRLPERTRFMKGLFAWVGYRQTAVYFDREPRFQGQTKWNYWKLWNFALDGIISFSLVPLKIWSYLGLIISLISLVYASFLVLRTLILGIDVPGYASLMVAILFLGGVQLISLGVLGEYLGRVYEEVKARPLYLAREVQGFPAPEEQTIDSDL